MLRIRASTSKPDSFGIMTSITICIQLVLLHTGQCSFSIVHHKREVTFTLDSPLQQRGHPCLIFSDQNAHKSSLKDD